MSHPPGAEPLTLGTGFDPADRDAWRREVDRVLDRSGKLDAEALAARFEQVLVTTTVDGLRIDPLYTSESAAPDPGWPGQPGFVRGSEALGRRTAGWDVRQPVAVAGDDADVRDRVLAELERGTTQVLLELADADADTGTLADRLDRCLEGVHLDLAALALDAAGAEAVAADAVVEVARRRGVALDQLHLVAGIDPLGQWLRCGGATDVDGDLAAAVAWTQRAATELPLAVPLRADGALIHEAGGGDVEELGTSIALGVHLLRVLEQGGVPLDVAARAIEFRYAATPDQFLTIAKLRAARRLWHRVTSVVGVDTAAQRQRQHAVTSTAATARYDVWVNLLRNTVAAFGAGVGGADAVTVRPHDELVAGTGSPAGRRLARNAQLILIEESNLARVVDIAGGSWYVESLTDQLARAAWAWFQELEAAGGPVAAARSGLLQDRVDAVAERRTAAVATRRHPLTGLSEFPAIDETPPPSVDSPATPSGPIRALTPRRHAQPVEDRRGRADRIEQAAGSRPEILLVALGTPAAHTARVTFSKNLFEVGGIRAVVSDPITDPAAAAAAFAASGARLACICSSDDVYRELAAPVAAALRAADRPPQRLYLAGRPSGLDDELRAAGVDEHIVAGCDVLAVLDGALDLLEGAS